MDSKLPAKRPQAGDWEQRIDRYQRPPQPPSFMACALVGCLLSAIVVIVVSVAGLTVAKDWFEDLTVALDIFNPGETRSFTTLPNVEEIRKLGRLDTVEMDLSTMVKIVNRRGTLVKSDEVLVYNVCGRAIIGVDLDKLEEQDVIVSGTAITISLPPVEVFSVDPVLVLNVSESDEYDIGGEGRSAQILPACNKERGWTVPFGMSKTPDLIRDAQKQAMAQFRSIAEGTYTLELARQNAETELGRFLTLMGYDVVKFVPPEQ